MNPANIKGLFLASCFPVHARQAIDCLDKTKFLTRIHAKARHVFHVDQQKQLLWQVKFWKIPFLPCRGLRRFKATPREKEMAADADAALSVWGKTVREGRKE